MRQNVQRERRHRTRWRAPLAVCGFACVLIAQAGEMPGYPPPPGSYPVGRLPAAAAEVAPSAAPSKDSRPSGAPATDGPAYGPGTPDLATRLFGAQAPRPADPMDAGMPHIPPGSERPPSDFSVDFSRPRRPVGGRYEDSAAAVVPYPMQSGYPPAYPAHGPAPAFPSTYPPFGPDGGAPYPGFPMPPGDTAVEGFAPADTGRAAAVSPYDGGSVPGSPAWSRPSPTLPGPGPAAPAPATDPPIPPGPVFRPPDSIANETTPAGPISRVRPPAPRATPPRSTSRR